MARIIIVLITVLDFDFKTKPNVDDSYLDTVPCAHKWSGPCDFCVGIVDIVDFKIRKSDI